MVYFTSQYIHRRISVFISSNVCSSNYFLQLNKTNEINSLVQQYIVVISPSSSTHLLILFLERSRYTETNDGIARTNLNHFLSFYKKERSLIRASEFELVTRYSQLYSGKKLREVHRLSQCILLWGMDPDILHRTISQSFR